MLSPECYLMMVPRGVRQDPRSLPGRVRAEMDRFGALTQCVGALGAGFHLPRLEAVEPWTQAGLEAAIRAFADEAGLKLGKAAQPLRAALTGRPTSPGIFDVLEVLGREESLARLRDQVHASKPA